MPDSIFTALQFDRSAVQADAPSAVEPAVKPALYLVPVPIGNREDITLRALAVLASADVIASEDTRTTAHLLRLYGISGKKLVSYHDHNERQRAKQLVELISAGAVLVLVSEAGSPCISDPGYRLVQAAVQAGVEVVALPGATAFVPALSASGLPVHTFTFWGFPPHKKGRQTFLAALVRHPYTSIVYESSHRVVKLLEELCALGASERHASIAREMTKLHEEHLRGTVEFCRKHLSARSSQKGEFVLVLHGAEVQNDHADFFDNPELDTTENAGNDEHD